MFPHGRRERIALRQKVRPPVMRHDALGVARGARSVVDRNCVPLVLGHEPGEVRIAIRKEGLVVLRIDLTGFTGKLGIVVLDQRGLNLREFERLLHQGHEFTIDDDDLRHGMIELECDDRGIEARVDRMQHAPAHRHAVMTFQHRGCVRQHRRNRVAAPDTHPGQRRRELTGSRVEVCVGPAERAVHDGDVIRKDMRRAFEKGQRRERLVVRRVAVEIGVVWVGLHRLRHPATAVLVFR